VEEYIIRQEGDVAAYETPLPTGSAQRVAEAYARGFMSAYKPGYLVLTNKNLYYVALSLGEGVAVAALGARTPFGIGRKAVMSKKLSLEDVYRGIRTPGSLVIPLKDIRFVEYRKYFGGSTLTVGFIQGNIPRVYSFNFRGFKSREDFYNDLKRWVLHEGGAVDAKAEIFTPRCPTCGKPATWIPQYKRWYCYNCQKYL